MKISGILRTLASITLALASIVPAGAQVSQSELPTPMNMNSRGLMISGYDPVAYIDYGEATLGIPDIYFDYRNTYRFQFASKVTMKKFMSDPDRYLPAYGGHCGWLMASGKGGAGELRPADPKVYAVVEGRVYLFSSEGAREEWSRDAAGNIHSADANWDAVVESVREQMKSVAP